MGKAARRKGAAGELEFWARIRLADPGNDVSRDLTASRDGGDDGIYRGISLEIKRHRRINLSAWYRQAVAQSAGLLPAVAFRVDREEWQVLPIMTPEQFVEFCKWRESQAGE